MFEVEQKYRVADFIRIEAQLRQRGIVVEDAIAQRDVYFAHPCRDFAATDEALRLRAIDGQNYITYKGPKIDGATKTRLEIEVPVAEGADAAALLEELLRALGFTRVRHVVKRRRRARFDFHDLEVELALDEVESLGRFVELETAADTKGLDRARAVLELLAQELELTGTVRESYLELLMRRHDAPPP